jgi:SAM-dependent methyltransferase
MISGLKIAGISVEFQPGGGHFTLKPEPTTNSSSAMPNDLEPLTELAVYSFQNALQLCVEEHACCDYHRIWSLARLANPIGPNLAGWQFLHRQLAILTDTQPSPRVLISGAADTGLLSLVLAGLKDSHANAQIILVDRCATPVRQNEQLCEKLNADAQFYVADILNFDGEPVDVILAHSFLNFFDPAERGDLFANWARLLNPNGKILLSNRIEQQPGVKLDPPSCADLESRLNVLKKVANTLELNDVDQKSLIDAAKRCRSKELTSKPAFTDLELGEIVRSTGLQLQSLSLHEQSARKGKGPLATAYSDQGKRAEIVQQRVRVD